MKKRCLALLLALVMALALTAPAFAARVDVSNMPGHEVLAGLPETLRRPDRPANAVQARSLHSSDLSDRKWTFPQSIESVFQEIVDLTDSLTAGKTTDTQKMKAIYEWVSQNIEYDGAAYSYWRMENWERTEEQKTQIGMAGDPFYGYARRLAFCDGYARLCMLMGAIAEIPVARINGISNELNRGPHAWNAALVDGRWLFFDATWREWDMAPNYHTSSYGFTCYDGLFQLSGFIWNNVNEIEVVFRPGFQCPANVTIPSYATQIGYDAFTDCTSLKSVTIHDGVNQIGGMAFEGCTGLESINIPDGVTEINNYIFSGCTSLKSIAIPDKVTRIWAWAFKDCTSLKSVTIPDSVTSIGQGAFYGCSGLESVTLGSGVTKEAVDRVLAFEGCTNLKSMNFSKGGAITGRDEFFSIENGVLTKYTGYGGSVVIPEGVTEIGPGVFVYCENMTSVTFPSTLTKISGSAFSHCTGLTGISIPASVTSIESGAFSYCSGLKSVTIPATVTKMSNPFYSCTGLTSVTLQEGVTDISTAFGNCTSLTSVTVPGSVKNTGGAFYDCTGLKSVTLQEGIIEIGTSTFQNCTNLTSVAIPAGVTRIGNAAFDGCTGLKSVAIPASMTRINRLAFRDCTGLTDVYYGGTEAQWKAIQISKEENDALTSAAIHYNSPMPAPAEPETPVAYPSNQTVTIDGKPVEFQMYALKDENGDDTNYIQIRDLAYALNGTRAQFAVDWTSERGTDLVPGKTYTPTGSENKTPFTGKRPYTTLTAPTNVNGAASDLTAFFLTDDNGGDYTYYKLRSLGEALGFNVGYSDARGVFIETDRPYDPND